MFLKIIQYIGLFPENQIIHIIKLAKMTSQNISVFKSSDEIRRHLFYILGMQYFLLIRIKDYDLNSLHIQKFIKICDLKNY